MLKRSLGGMEMQAYVLSDEAALGEDDTNLCVVSSEPHVAGHSQTESDPNAAAVDGANHWLAQLE